MPIDLCLSRAKEVPKVVFDCSSLVSVGITGADTLWEAGRENQGQEIIIYPKISGPRMYFGVYPNFADRFNNLEDLDGEKVATKYPRITREAGERSGVNLITREFSGGIEGKNNLYSDIPGLMDVIDSGRTAKANGIKILEEFYKINARMIDAPGKMTPMELVIFEDLQELIEVAKLRKKGA